MRWAWVILLICNVAGVATPSAPAAEPSSDDDAKAADLPWQPFDAAAQVHTALVDCRSPTIEHERRVPLEKPWAMGGRTLTFTRQGDGLTVQLNAETDGRPEDTHAMPAAPSLLRLRAFGRDYGLTVRPDADGRAVRVASAYGVAVPAGSRQAYLIDSDLDGVVGSAGDGVVVPGSRTVGPMQTVTQVWTRSRGLAVKRDQAGTWLAARLSMPKPTVSDHGAAWRHWMWQRQLCGLIPLEYDDRFEAAMQRHANYLLTNNIFSHREDPRLPGYTREGAAAGMSCVIGFQKQSHLQAVQSQMLTLFHRTSCLAPELQAGAMLLHQGVFMANTKSRLGGPLRDRPLVYPPHGMTFVPCEFNIAGEAPMPIDLPGGDNTLGTVVAVRFASLYWAAGLAKPPTLTVVAVAADGAEQPVAGRFFYPGNAPRVQGLPWSYLGHVALVPTQPLEPNTLHHAAIEMLFPAVGGGRGKEKDRSFTYDWTFTTGPRRPRR